MKKIFYACFTIFLALCLSVIGLSASAVNAKQAQTGLEVKGKSAILIDAASGNVLYTQNETERYPIASMTKIMTLLLTFEEIDKGNLKLDEEITVSENASGMGGSQVFLDANASYKASDLIKSVVVASANDASVALAERIAGSEENFVRIMNQKAKALGMENTSFANATGLPAAQSYSSAEDVGKMFKALINHKEYFNYSTIYLDTLTHPSGRETGLTNTNKLVKFYQGCDAGKTGSTSEAKFCLCATAKRGDVRLVACVIGSDNAKIRNAEVSKLFNYGFSNFKNIIYVNKGATYEMLVPNAKSKTVKVLAEEGFSMLVEKNFVEDVVVCEKFDEIKAPLKKGSKVGEIIISRDGKVMKTINLVLDSDVKASGYFDNVKDVLNKWAI